MLREPKSPFDFPALTDVLDRGIHDEEKDKALDWNERRIDRYPLSPSRFGACARAVARDIAHYHGLADYPKTQTAIRLAKIFARGKALEDAILSDFQKYTGLGLSQRQQRLLLFTLSAGKTRVDIEGDCDVLFTNRAGFRLLADVKTKGAYTSAVAWDSVQEMFDKIGADPAVKHHGTEESNCFVVEELDAFLGRCDKSDFLYGYILQLNSYAHSDWFLRTGVDACSIYYENKNNSNHYELRWVPSEKLFRQVREKWQDVFKTTIEKGPEEVPKDFTLGSIRCKLCEYHEVCWGERPPFNERAMDASQIPGVPAAYSRYSDAASHMIYQEKAEEEILVLMENAKCDRIKTADGKIWERKLLKSPKPHYELRQSK